MSEYYTNITQRGKFILSRGVSEDGRLFSVTEDEGRHGFHEGIQALEVFATESSEPAQIADAARTLGLTPGPAAATLDAALASSECAINGDGGVHAMKKSPCAGRAPGSESDPEAKRRASRKDVGAVAAALASRSAQQYRYKK